MISHKTNKSLSKLIILYILVTRSFRYHKGDEEPLG
jgi:hypothetical protein